MTEKPGPEPKSNSAFAERIRGKAALKLKARGKRRGVWFGLGMMGLIGWSVAVPTLIGTALGRWLDLRSPEPRNWTLALLVAGLTLGCFNAWRWVANEEKAIREEREDK